MARVPGSCTQSRFPMEMFSEDFQWRSSSVICNGDVQWKYLMNIFNGCFQRRFSTEIFNGSIVIFNGEFQWRFSMEIFNKFSTEICNGAFQWRLSIVICNWDFQWRCSIWIQISILLFFHRCWWFFDIGPDLKQTPPCTSTWFCWFYFVFHVFKEGGSASNFQAIL